MQDMTAPPPNQLGQARDIDFPQLSEHAVG